MRRSFRCWPSWLICLLGLVLWLLLCGSAQGSPRWDSQVARRISARSGTIRRAAWEQGLDPLVLAAVVAYETGAIPQAGRWCPDCLGPCQVHWPSWGKRLREWRIAEVPEDLLRWEPGVCAAAAILAYLRDYYQIGSLSTLLCTYGGPLEALDWKHCDYAEGVLGLLPLVAQAMWEAP